MNARLILVIAACLVVGLMLGQFSTGQQIVVPQPAIGRYHMSVAGPNGTVNVCNTSTGECWIYQGDMQWRSLGSPALQAKAAK